ncbi:hypothetical protein CVIRNUC_011011 [Coccomyxa viridis]|uniref:Fungal lipase-type domain-containing protein n=1 Tax=Coccomyxa viridis TaxID=1274662 RepID=A0AAV1IP88_9CHLO|nr:hypothetical protein CVIRNUC_011011 [Coccomyxa viridis]
MPRGSRSQAKVGQWVAKSVHAGIEGFAFLWTVAGFRIFLAANSLVLCYYMGPRRSTTVAAGCALACAAGKFAHVLATTEKFNDGKELASIWDYDPPGDLAGSGAWTVLREIATTLGSANEIFPELKDLPPLPIHEMALRLCFLYDDHDKHPEHKDIPGDKQFQDEDKLKHLAEMLWYADQAYEGESERTLSKRLEKRGFGLVHVKLTSTWAEHCPAYFLAISLEKKEVIISVRGTAQVEDVITDLTALPREFGKEKHMVHSGMYASAEWLRDRLYCVAQGLHEAGFQIIIVGHSLGAGAASLLALIFKSMGIDNLSAYGFGCPPCVGQRLAEMCAEYVMTVALRDDVITRFSPQALERLQKELRDLDLEAAKQAEDKRQGLEVVMQIYNAVERLQNMKFPGMASDVDEKGDSAEDKALKGEESRKKLPMPEEKLQRYHPVLPGKVLYLCRSKGEDLQRAMVDGDFEGLQRICLTSCMITDHMANSYYDGLGHGNLTQQTLIEEGKMEDPKKKKDAEESAGDEEDCAQGSSSKQQEDDDPAEDEHPEDEAADDTEDPDQDDGQNQQKA